MVFYKKLWEKNKEEFIEIVSSCKSYNSILTYFGEKNGGYIRMLRYRVKKENIDVSHFRCDTSNNLKQSLDQILIADSSYKGNGTALKKKLFNSKLLDNKCARCGIKGGKTNFPKTEGFINELVLQLDHINGIHNDNRIENLRILCPNCHSQTTSFCGRNKKFTNLPRCLDCKKRIRSQSKRCIECYKKSIKTKTQHSSVGRATDCRS